MFRLTSKQAFKLKPMSVHHYQPRRVISTVPRRNTDGCSHHDNGHRHDSNSGDAGSKSTLFVTWREFSQLGKDVSHVKLKLDHLVSGLKDLNNRVERGFESVDRRFERTDSKIDRVLYSIMAGLLAFVLKGGIDYYYPPAPQNCSHTSL